MGKPTEKLDPNGINILLEEVKGRHSAVPFSSNPPTVDLINQVSESLGDYDHRVGEGADLFLVLMYQNLLLAKRVTELEAQINGD